MAKKKMKKINLEDGFVFSTNEDFTYEEDTNTEETLEPNQQTLHVLIDRKQRGGKEVTLIQNFIGSEDTLPSSFLT